MPGCRAWISVRREILKVTIYCDVFLISYIQISIKIAILGNELQLQKSSPSGKPTFSTSNTFKTKRTLKKILLSQSFKMGTGIQRFIQLRIKKVGSFCAGNKCWACGQKANLWCITLGSLLRDWFGGRNLKRCKMSMSVFIRKQDICGNCHVDHMRFRVHTASAHWVF